MILLAALALFLGLCFHDYAFDDPFITYRVAGNLARGHGFVYNPPERVNALTSPLHAVGIAALIRLTGAEAPLIGAFITMAGLFLAAMLVARLVDGDCPSPGGYLAGALILCQPLLVRSMGMETGLLMALCAGSMLAYKKERFTLCGLLLGLCLLTRPDSGLVAVPILAHFLLAKRRLPPAGAAAALALVLAPWFLFSFFYYGELIPHTLTVKRAQSALGGHWGGEWMFARALAKTAAGFIGEPDLTGLLVGACLLFGFHGILKKRSPWSLLILSWSALHALAYALVLRVPPYTWYFAPVLLGLALIGGLGARCLVETVAERKRWSWLFLAAAGMGISVWAITSLAGIEGRANKLFNPIHAGHLLGYLGLTAAWALPRFAPERFASSARSAAAVILVVAAFLPRYWNGYVLIAGDTPTSQYRHYRQAAEWIQENRPRAAAVGAHEIGVLGYFLHDRTIIDQCGIPTPGAAERLGRGDVTWWIANYRPDLLILHPARGWWEAVEGPIRDAPWFPEAYQRVALLSEGDTEAEPEKHDVEIWELVKPEAVPLP